MDIKSKKYILDNIGKVPEKKIAEHLGIKERKVRKFIAAHKDDMSGTGGGMENLSAETVRISVKNYAISICAIIMIVTLAFAPAINNDFINWDDNKYVTDNPHIKEPTAKNIKTLLTTSFVGTYQPVVNISYLIEHSLFGPKAAVYHATNILIHAANSVLVFLVFALLDGNLFVSLSTALLFGAHPLRVESVAWVSERKDVLYALFYLWALLNYCLYVKRGSRKYYRRALPLFVLSLGSKAMAVTLPVVFFAVDYLTRRQFSKKTLMEKVPFFALALIFGVIALFSQGKPTGMWQGGRIDIFYQLSAAFYGMIMYVYKAIAPLNLSLMYPYPPRNALYYSVCFISVVFIISAISLAIFSRRYTRKVIFSLSFALITILPVLQLIPIGSSIMADRYTYLPSVAVSYLAGLGLLRIYNMKSGSGQTMKHMTTAALALFIAGMSYLTYERSKVWKDSITVFSDVINKYPEVYMAYNNRGVAYLGDGRTSDAIADFERSIAINRDQFGVYNNLGIIYNKMNMPEKSMEALRKAMSLNPDYAGTYNNLGNTYARLGREREALEAFEKAVKLDPNFSDAYYNMAELFKRAGDEVKAAEFYKKSGM